MNYWRLSIFYTTGHLAYYVQYYGSACTDAVVKYSYCTVTVHLQAWSNIQMSNIIKVYVNISNCSSSFFPKS